MDSFDDVLLAKKEEAEHFGGTELEDANLEEENSDDLEFEARAPKRKHHSEKTRQINY